MAQYGKADYWEDRYQKDKESFDFYQRYEHIKNLLNEYVPSHQSTILQLGCGNSKLAEDMCNNGYRVIQNVDISFHVIKQM